MNAPQKLRVKAALTILKPVHEVFEAIADPAKMSNYFIATGTGRMEEAKTVQWQFPEMNMKIPVRIQKVKEDQFVSFQWDDIDGTATLVEMTLQPKSDLKTFVSITEGSKDNNEAGIDWLRRNTEGWANFLACLKAWLEYGINLRKGAFDPSQMPVKEDASAL
jgi:uncharacterized protein YndB with AHSA1/START domain